MTGPSWKYRFFLLAWYIAAAVITLLVVYTLVGTLAALIWLAAGIGALQWRLWNEAQ